MRCWVALLLLIAVGRSVADENLTENQPAINPEPAVLLKVIKTPLAPVPALTLYQFNNTAHQAVLRTPTRSVSDWCNPKWQRLARAMDATMKANQGVELSANQVGEPIQLFLLDPSYGLSPTSESDIYINPVIIEASKARSSFWHGCLSAKGEKLGQVATWDEITIKACDLSGKPFTKYLKGMAAIIAQHEFRHLLGGGYLDHAKTVMTEPELMEAVAEGKIGVITPCDEHIPLLLNDYRVGETIAAYAQRKDH